MEIKPFNRFYNVANVVEGERVQHSHGWKMAPRLLCLGIHSKQVRMTCIMTNVRFKIGMKNHCRYISIKSFHHKHDKNILWKLTSFFSGVDLTPFMDLTWECLTTSPMWGTNTRATTSTKTKKFSSTQVAGFKRILDVCTRPSKKPGTALTSMGRRLWGS